MAMPAGSGEGTQAPPSPGGEPPELAVGTRIEVELERGAWETFEVAEAHGGHQYRLVWLADAWDKEDATYEEGEEEDEEVPDAPAETRRCELLHDGELRLLDGADGEAGVVAWRHEACSTDELWERAHAQLLARQQGRGPVAMPNPQLLAEAFQAGLRELVTRATAQADAAGSQVVTGEMAAAAVESLRRDLGRHHARPPR